jgi:F0F1-type ATP synthase membrane subunit c/vacuolar-type H+-ATPase subunit K
MGQVVDSADEPGIALVPAIHAGILAGALAHALARERRIALELSIDVLR